MLFRSTHRTSAASKLISIFFYFLLGAAIVMMGSDLAAVPARSAQSLSLPGAGLVRYVPWVQIAVYVLILSVTRRASKWWIRFGGILAACFLASVPASFPDWLLEMESTKIEIGSFATHHGFLPADEVAAFEQTFNTPTVQYGSGRDGPWLVVPRSKFSPSMVSFLRDWAKEKSKPSDGAKANGTEPILSG